ncbi:hypothetical protein [Chenggangzhangella methanolivorans]|uniref:Uncharacterized protein n=1 Tax=Chenggangzhangella methanolivorans TaxID=1437009 RepID=A0A9E6R998_9HYPH|nr:hypothetical protein [Chenggangzhangella methanolivorans]QZO00130.1 hypothetical protein K6K41_26870 [Chenggangzhangella methanolivorans]
MSQDDHIRGGARRKRDHDCDGSKSDLWIPLWLECHSNVGLLPEKRAGAPPLLCHRKKIARATIARRAGLLRLISET